MPIVKEPEVCTNDHNHDYHITDEHVVRCRRCGHSPHEQPNHGPCRYCGGGVNTIQDKFGEDDDGWGVCFWCRERRNRPKPLTLLEMVRQFTIFDLMWITFVVAVICALVYYMGWDKDDVPRMKGPGTIPYTYTQD